MSYRLYQLPGRTAERTRQVVEELARLYGGHPLMRFLCVDQIVRPRGLDERDQVGMVRAIYEFVRDSIRFVAEPGEQVQTPARTLLWGYGDCDCKTALTCALLESVGLTWRTVLLSRNGVPFHILPQALVGGRWTHLEVSDKRALFGEDPRELMRRIGVAL